MARGVDEWGMNEREGERVRERGEFEAGEM